MNRNININSLDNKKCWDFIIIGGGATGIGIAYEAVSRGYTCVLLEKSDFTKSTSSKSTKLIHGGVRYLAQGNVALVREAAIERGLLVKNAPHLVKNLTFIVPANGIIDDFKFSIGLKIYDFIAGKFSLGKSKRISKKRALEEIQTLKPEKMTAGIQYQDGQFDDSRLAINMLQTIEEKGGLVFNYFNITGLLKNNQGEIEGVIANNEISNTVHNIKGKQVINATGVFADTITKLDNPKATPKIVPSQGIHFIVDKSYLPGNKALMIPKTSDGRVLFLVPWHNKVIIGTTDELVDKISDEPIPLEKEIDFLMKTVNDYIIKPLTKKDILSVYAGLRPLVASDDAGATKEISRGFKITYTNSKLLTIVGGKWTTFRKMGEDVVNQVESHQNWEKTTSPTKTLKIHGYQENINFKDPHYFYGSDLPDLKVMAKKENLEELISEKLYILKAQIIWAVRHEMAINIEDFLARRTRSLLLDAEESLKIAPIVAKIMAHELGHDNKWEKEQIHHYKTLTENYLFK